MEFIKISLEADGGAWLIRARIRATVEDMVSELCSECGLPYAPGTRALLADRNLSDTRYVTDANKTRLRDGCQLRLVRPPSERIRRLLERLEEDPLPALEKLSTCARDGELLREIHSQGGLLRLRVAFRGRSPSAEELCQFYRIAERFLLAGYADEGMEDEEVEDLVRTVREDRTSEGILILAFRLIVLLVKMGKLRWRTDHLPDLLPYLRQHDRVGVQQSVLLLLETLYEHAEDRDAIFEFATSPTVLTHITKYVIRSDMEDSTKCRLSAYQRIILGKYLCAGSSLSVLAGENLAYYAGEWFGGSENVLGAYEVDEMSCASQAVTRAVRRALGMERFIPLCFLHYESVMQKTFCIAMDLFDKTRRDLGVSARSVDEYAAVAETMREQLEAGLESEPLQFLELETELKEWNAERIKKRREKRIREDVERELREDARFVELRKTLLPRIVEEVAEKRVRFAQRGEHVPNRDRLGQSASSNCPAESRRSGSAVFQRVPDTRWFVSVSATRDELRVDECGDDPCQNRHVNLVRVGLEEVVQVEWGKKSNAYRVACARIRTERDMFFRAGILDGSEPELESLISLRLRSREYVDLCVGTSRSMNYWVDALNYLRGEEMNSVETREDVEYLLDVELMARFAQVEGIQVDDTPPEVPPLPMDFSFATP